ncbi:MAG TPA: helix-turn-helix domain-containing protein [Micromonosporaceae bacterium]|nr:helix-turn-helix domain-containing protein [Micromonosporaceae bacterium]
MAASATSTRPRRHRVVVLALDEVIAFDLGVPTQIFHAARDRQSGRRHYDVSIITPDGAPVRSSAGFTVTPDHGPELLAEADTMIVTGIGRHSRHFNGELAPEVAAAFAALRPGTRVMSICTGAFVLAAAGLLDDRPATTHWAYADLFRELFPRVRLDPGVLFVDDGDVLTSAGVAAGIDLCLHVIRRDLGSEVANRAARRGVVPPWRDGGQSQYIEAPVPEPEDAGTAATRQWATSRLGEGLDLAAMARHARMSVRTFTRRFRAETGMSPGRWLIRQRVEHARRLLETTDLPVDRVAEASGFGTATSLRQHLHAEIGVAPAAYRRTFRGEAADR